jgi:DNA recombination protein RmuC
MTATTILLTILPLATAFLGLMAGRVWGRREGASGLEAKLALAEHDAKGQRLIQEQRDRDAEKLREELRGEMRSREAGFKEDTAALLQDLSNAKSRIAELETTVAKDKEVFAVERMRMDEVRSKLWQEFEGLANRIFESKSASFDAKSREGLNALLVPFKEQLESFRKRVDQLHTESTQGQSALKNELEHLRQLNQQVTEEASNLTKALKGDKRIQGDWGEQKLELLLEHSGLRKGEEYEAQRTFRNEDGEIQRPDIIVKLPEGKCVVIDSKVSLVDYSAYVAAEVHEERLKHLSAHIAAIRAHVKSLSIKRYHDLPSLDSPDFTMMFIPIEPAYLAAAEHEPSLFQDAYDARVAIVTATTLLPVLRVVANLWAVQRQNRSTLELTEQAARIVDKLGTFVDKMKALGNQMNTAQNTYLETMRTLSEGKGNLVATVAKFEELGVKVQPKLLQLAQDGE